MERKLKGLFDYQKFDGNMKLQSVIDSVHSRYGMRELDMDEIGMVSAAGIPEIMKRANDAKEHPQ